MRSARTRSHRTSVLADGFGDTGMSAVTFSHGDHWSADGATVRSVWVELAPIFAFDVACDAFSFVEGSVR